MNWITGLLTGKPTKKATQKHIPDNLWIKCDSCGAILYAEDLKEDLFVCNNCGNHFHIPTKNRLEMIFDASNFKVLSLHNIKEDPIHFKDSIKYKDRLKLYRQKTKQNDAITIAYGKISGVLSCIAVLDFKFMGGSMGSAVGNAMIQGMEFAINQNIPFIVVTSSGGARMQEGIVSLMQMPKIIIGVEKLENKKLPFIVILSNPTMGGVTASFAMLGDIHIAEKGAQIGFAGPRVIEQTMKKKLPNGFQSAEFLQEKGMVDIVCERKQLKNILGMLLKSLETSRKKKKNK